MLVQNEATRCNLASKFNRKRREKEGVEIANRFLQSLGVPEIAIVTHIK
jgi:hypothetical protein